MGVRLRMMSSKKEAMVKQGRCGVEALNAAASTRELNIILIK